MLHKIRRLIVAYPNWAICCCGVLMLLVPFALAALNMVIFVMYEEGTFASELLFGLFSLITSTLRYVAYASWTLGSVLILCGVVREYRRPATARSADPLLRSTSSEYEEV